MKKQQVNVRLSPAYIDMLHAMKEFYHAQGYAYSQADVIEMALLSLEQSIDSGNKTTVRQEERVSGS